MLSAAGGGSTLGGIDALYPLTWKERSSVDVLSEFVTSLSVDLRSVTQ